MRFAGVLVAGAILVVAFFAVKPRSWAVVAAVPAVALPGVWSLVSALSDTTTARGPSAEGPIALAAGALRTVFFWFTMDHWPRGPMVVVGLFAGASALALTLRCWGPLRPAVKALYVVAALYLISLYCVRVVVAMDVLTDRLLIPLVPLLAVAMAATVDMAWRSGLWSKLGVAAVTGGLFFASRGSVLFSRIEIPYEVAWQELRPACSYGTCRLP